MIIGFLASSFDLGPHAGHMAMLKEAKQNCARLIIGLHVNPKAERDHKNKPIPSLSERFITLSGCKYVDQIIPYETEEELLELLRLLMPDIRFLGSDYEGKDFTGKELPILVHYCDRLHNISSSRLRKQILETSLGQVTSK